MAALDEVRDRIGPRLADLAAEHQVPGASIAVAVGDDVVEAAVGVLDKEIGYPATTDSIFQVGSITKIWTATMVMQLVDEGCLALDAPVHNYLPEFRVIEELATGIITVRQMLCHTAGFEGDIFDDLGPGDDAVERFVANLAGSGHQLFAPGAMFSYANSGYVVLGRLVEVLTGMSWEAAVRERLAAPLGMTQVATLPSEAIRHRVAMGHIPAADGTQVKAPIWALPRSNAPAGSTLAVTARELVRLAGLHIRGGLAADGTRVLSAASVKAMTEPQVEVPRIGVVADHWGLGWALFDWPGGPVIGHDGSTVGQASMLRIVPDRGVTVALLTNGGHLLGIYPLIRELLAELADVTVPELPVPPTEAPVADPVYFAGRYESAAARYDVEETETGFRVSTRVLGALAEMTGELPQTKDMVPLDARRLIAVEVERAHHEVIAFIGDGATADFVHMGRAIPRG